MKRFALLIFVGLISGCFPSKSPVEQIDLTKTFEENGGYAGSFLTFSEKNKVWRIYNNDHCVEGFLPASTYKIVNSLIALEAGVVSSAADSLYWDGEMRWNEPWNKDMDLQTAFRVSCVPCYQEMARKTGYLKMREHLNKIPEYGTLVFDSSTVDNFWLVGDSRVNSFQQVEMLRRLHAGTLPFAAENMETVRSLMLAEETESYVLRAKTGLCRQGEGYVGWYVGYVETADDTHFFSLILENEAFTQPYAAARVSLTNVILKKLGILK
ncbi:MAG: penicillin-binding transpeptidase domain-containing protein [Calditrichia bacterium]